MEHHFILRFAKGFKENINIYESKIERLDNDKVKLIYKNKTYPGLVVPLPCIVESQKTLDNKQFYKVCDVSTLVVIYPDEEINENEKKILQLSGLTPPLKFVKARRFKKKNVKIQEVEEIEQKVQELLDRDRKATRVEIVSEDVDLDVENIAAELESNIEVVKDVEVVVEEKGESQEILDLKKQIEEQQKKVDDALNPILKQRFQNVLNELKKKLEALKRQ